ncbi:MAG: Uma2 family endonuclease [Candidatus Velthaea sp.]
MARHALFCRIRNAAVHPINARAPHRRDMPASRIGNVDPLSVSDMALEYELRNFTVDEYHRMAEIGIFDSDERIELLDGKLVRMSPTGVSHVLLHARIVKYLNARLPHAAVIGQGSFELGPGNEPRPDVAILRQPIEAYFGRSFQPTDLAAMIEVADSSLAKDIGPKLSLYARFGIPDYLVVDIQRNRLLHHAEPNDFGYSRTKTLAARDTFRVECFPSVEFAAAEFLAPE